MTRKQLKNNIVAKFIFSIFLVIKALLRFVFVSFPTLISRPFKSRRAQLSVRMFVQLTILIGLFFFFKTYVFATAVSWDGGAGTSNWSDQNNWSNNLVPNSSDDVTIDSNVTVNIAAGTTVHSLTLGNAGGTTTPTLNFTYDAIGTSAPLTITGGDLTVYSNATVTHSAGTTMVVGSVNINVTSGNANITGSINANSKGYAGVATGVSGTAGNGTGGGGTISANGAGGAGHGGAGGGPSLGGATGGTTYGSYYSPVTYGSSGGEDGYTGGGQRTSAAGGGAIQLTVSGATSVAGSIVSNGATAGNDGSGGGAGGSVNLTTGSISGAGSITANGGSAASGTYSGSGGGGRIAIKYSSSNSFYGSGSGTGSLTATAGTTGYSLGEVGTVVVVDTANNDLYVNKTQIWRVKNSLGTTVEGASFNYHNIIIGNQTATTLTLRGYNSNNSDGVGQTFNVTNFNVYSGSTVTGSGYGYPSATTGNAGSGSGGGGTASANGGGGGAHGGAGGAALSGAVGGSVYDSISAPVDLGSSGGVDNFSAGKTSGAGGGAIYVNASGKVTINGTVSMNGNNSSYDAGGAGAGGSVYLRGSVVTGAGSLSATGGNAFSTTYSGGGGGGRIAIYRSINEFKGTISVAGGTGKNAGGTGTIYWGNLPNLVWRFEEGSGSTANDSSGLGNSGTLANSPTFDPISNAGDNRFSLKLNGTNQYVSKSYSSDQELDPYTDSFAVGAWFKHSSTISGTDVLTARYSSGGYKIYMNSSGFICFAIDDDSSWTPDDSVCGTTSLADAAWHYVQGVKSSTTSISLYIDGVLIGTKTSLTATGSLSGSSPTFYAGIDSDGTSNPWDGNIDEVIYVSGDRTASQVKADYNLRSTLRSISDPATAYQSTFATAGTGAYWKFDDSSWSTACSAYDISDSSGNSNSAKACGGGSAPTSGQLGKNSNGLVLNGTGYAQVASSSTIQGMSSMTLMGWIKPTQCAGTSGGVFSAMIMRKKWIYSLSLNNGTCNLSLYLSTNGTGWSTNNVSSGTVTTGQWNHVAAVYDGSKYYFYINGVAAGSGTTNVSGAIGSNSNALDIGTGQDLDPSAYNFVGSLDDLKIYNRALSLPEISQVYNNYFTLKSRGFWNFEDLEGTTVNDRSGNNSAGTYSGPGKFFTQGKFGRGANFKGVSDTVSIANETYFDFDKTQAFSVGAWVKPNITRSGGEAFYSVISKLDSSSPFSGWELNLDWNQASLTNKTTAKFRLVNTNATNNIEVNGSTDLVNNQWYYVAVTYDGTSSSNGVKMYVNGMAENPTVVYNNLSASTLNNISPYIGSRNNSTAFFSGIIDEVAVYSYARTAKQIIEDLNGGHPAGGSPVGSMLNYWRFDEGFGITSVDAGPQNVTATLNGMVSPASVGTSGWLPAGKFGRGVSFDGTNDYVDLTDLAYTESASQLTWSFWVNPNAIVATKCLMCKYNNAASQRSWAIETGTSNASAIRVTVPTSTSEADGTTFGETPAGILNVGVWTHIAVVYDGTGTGNSGRLKIFANGKQIGLVYSGTIPATTQATTSNATLGASSDNSRNFSGQMDEVKIYSGALSQAEIQIDQNRNQTVQNGSLSINSSGVASSSASSIYCPPGDTSTCDPPVGEWNFEEKQGSTVNDISGNVNTGTWGGTGGKHYVSGKVGSSGQFNGSDDRVDITTSTSLTPSFVSVSAWFKTTSTASQIIFRKRTGGYGLEMGNYASGASPGQVSFWYYDGAVNIHNASSTSTYNDGQWHFATGTFDGSNVIIYVDGIQVGKTASSNGIGYFTGNIGIGRDADFNSGYFNGSIDQVRVYNYGRTPAQVAWDYNFGKPLAWWRFDDCQGSTVIDSSGNNHPATITIGAGGSQSSATNCNSGLSTDAWNNGKSGKFNYSLKTDGTDDYLTTSAFSPLASSGVTVSNLSWGGWFNPSTSVASKTLLEKASEFQLTTDGSSQPVCGIYYSGAFHNATAGSIPLTLGSWNHVLCTFDGATIRTYLNGLLIGSSSDSNSITAASSILYYGETSGGANFYEGKIDDVRIWNYALSSSQVKSELNQASSVRYGPSSGAP